MTADRHRLIDGRYVVQSVLGRGAHSIVYAVEDAEESGRARALKMASIADGTSQSDMYRAEFNVARQIRHPNIARVFHFRANRAGGAPYLVMERVAGPDFLQATNGGAMDTFCKLAAQLCRALVFLHRRGYAHGDLKPANIMVADWQGEPVLKLLDLGLVWEPHGTHRAEARGTLHYMAPEMLSGGPIDFRSDLYSLGVILYEALAGRRPFAAQGEALLAEIRSVPPVPPVVPRLPAPPALWEAVLSLLEKAPGARPSSAAAAIGALGEAVGLALPLETPETAQAYVRSVPFAGRTDLLSDWESRLDSLQNGRTTPTLFVVSGGWGSGKTRLMEELADRAEMRGVATFELRGHTLDRDREPGPQHVLNRTWQMAENTPCALLVDDAHSLPIEALRSLRSILRMSKRRRLLVACTVAREMVSRAGVAELLADDGDDGYPTRLGLEPLGETESREVVTHALPGKLDRHQASRLHHRSQGNPLFLVESLSSLVASQTEALSRTGVVDPTIDPSGPHADSLETLIDERVAALGDGLRVLRLCAVMGQPAAQRLIADSVGCSVSRMQSLVIRFEQLGLARERQVSSQPGVAMMQETIARRVREARTDDERAEIHRVLAETIRGGLEDPSAYGLSRLEAVSAIAEHFAAAGDLNRAGPYAMQAAVELEAKAQSKRAVRFARLALRAPRGCSLDRQRMLEVLGDALLRLGKGKEAAETLAEAIDAVNPSDDGLTLVRLQTKSAQALGLCRCTREALDLLAAARTRVAAMPGPSEEKSRLECAMGDVLITSREYTEALPHLELARDLAQASGSAPAEAEATRVLGVGLTRMRRHDDARACFERARSLFRKCNDEPRYAAATSGLARALKDLGRLGQAEELYHEAIATLEEGGSADRLASACNNMAVLYQMRHDWTRARRFYERAVQIREGLGVSTVPGWANLATVAAAAAQLGTALHASREALHAAEGSDPMEHADAAMRHAYTWYHVGDLTQAEEAVERALESLHGREDPRLRSGIHLLAGHCYRLRGQYERAGDEYGRSLSIGVETRAFRRIQNALTHIACLHLLEGKSERAHEAAQEALEAGGPDPDVVAMARGQTQYGRALHALGQIDEAADVLARAYATMERVNAPLWRAEVSAALASAHLDKGEMVYFSHYVADCLDAFDIATTDLQDDDLVETFLQDPRRREVFDMIEKAKDQHGL